MPLWPAAALAAALHGAPAAAAPAVDDLLAAPTSGPAPFLVGRCSRPAAATALLDGLGALAAAGPAAALLGNDVRDKVLPHLDPDAPVTLRASTEGATIEAGARPGTAARLAALMEFSAEGPGLWLHPRGAVRLADAGSQVQFTASAAGRADRLRAGTFPAGLGAALPPGEGCTLGVATAEGALLAVFPAGNSDGPLLLRMSIAQLDAAALARPLRPPVAVRTPAPPLATLSLGIAPGELVRAMGALNRTPIPAELEADLAALGEVLQAQGGAVLAVFPDRAFAGVVPATTPDGGPLPVRRLSRAVGRALARETGTPATRVGPARFRIETPKAVAFLEITPTGLVLAANEPLLDAVLAGAGTPWLSPAHAEAAASHLLTVRMDGSALPGALSALRLGAGLRATPDYLELSVFDRPPPEVLRALLPAMKAGFEAGKARAATGAGEGG